MVAPEVSCQNNLSPKVPSNFWFESRVALQIAFSFLSVICRQFRAPFHHSRMTAPLSASAPSPIALRQLLVSRFPDQVSLDVITTRLVGLPTFCSDRVSVFVRDRLTYVFNDSSLNFFDFFFFGSGREQSLVLRALRSLCGPEFPLPEVRLPLLLSS